MDIVVFKKSKEDRLKEFRDVLSPGDFPRVPASSVANQWSLYLELTVEPVGWQALWKLPPEDCEQYNLRYPTVVFVEVESVDFVNFTASVNILEVQENINIPKKHIADLKRLHLTHHQENAVNTIGTANSLDQLRFFYNHLWHPWDCNDSGDEDWIATHLEPRLDLYYEMEQGLLSREIAERISRLVSDGREIYSKKEELEMLYDEGMETVLSNESVDTAYTLMQLHKKLEPIKIELQFLEISAIRNHIVKKILKKKQESETYVVWNGQTLEGFIEFLNDVKMISDPNTAVKPSHSLQAGLDMAQAGDTFILSAGIHDLTSSSRFEEGGRISGVDKKLTAILRCPKVSDFFLDVCTGTLLVQNVSVESEDVKTAFLVRPKGTLELVNVKLNSLRCITGVLVLPGGHLRLDHCEITGCRTGVYCHPGGSVTISNSVISGCSVGLQVKQFGKTNVKIEDSLISDCRDVAIDIVDLNLSATGSVEILKDITGFSCSNFETKLNKTDVIVQKHNWTTGKIEPGCL